MLVDKYPDLVFIIRLVVAGILGGLIGLEREFRAKEAGIRTHFLVALGSALIMIISQYGFTDAIVRDPGRIAAQIVSGIGFLGAGIIIFRKESVQGLTTAAGLWVSAGIGMGVGCGMYLLGVAATILTLICFEILRLSSIHFGLITKVAHITFLAKNASALDKAVKELRTIGCRAANYSFRKESDGSLKVSMFIRYHAHKLDKSHDETIIRKIEKISGVKLEKFE